MTWWPVSVGMSSWSSCATWTIPPRRSAPPRRMVEAFRPPVHVGGSRAVSRPRASGWRSPATAGPGEDLVREADTAMYAAKAAGRDRVSVFNEDLRAAVAARLAIETRPASCAGSRPAGRLVPARGRPDDGHGDRRRGTAALAPSRRGGVDRRPVHRRRRGHRAHPRHRRLGPDGRRAPRRAAGPPPVPTDR